MRSKLTRRFVAWAGATVVALTSGSAFAQNAVIDWDEYVAPVASAGGRAPASSAYLHALAHLAIWDAVVSIEGGFTPYAGTVPVDYPVSVDAAVAAAAFHVAVARMTPSATDLATLQARYDESLAPIPEPERTNGVAVGFAAAQGLIAARAGDRFEIVPSYGEPSPIPVGVFKASAIPPVDINLSQVEPLLPRGIDEYRPPGPPALGSMRYTHDFEEAKASDASALSPWQIETARFWSDHTFRQFARTLRALATERALDTFETSRLLASVYLTVGDAALAGWEAKYHFLSWRPRDAIERAAEDGNDRTTAGAWTPVLPYANHPEYPSGHAIFTSAVMHVLHRFFGTDEIPLTIASDRTGTLRTYATLREIRKEVANARIWGGLHFRTAMDDGDRLGRDIAALSRHRLRALKGAD